MEKNLKRRYICVCVYIYVCVCMCVLAKSLQLCPTLCNPMDGSLPDSSVRGILQASILKWILPCFPPGDLPDPGIEPMSSMSPALQADSLPLSHQGSLCFSVLYHCASHLKLTQHCKSTTLWSFFKSISFRQVKSKWLLSMGKHIPGSQGLGWAA